MLLSSIVPNVARTSGALARGVALAASVATAGLLAGCSTPQGASEIHDPLESVNRGVHGFNKGVDRAVLRPASQAYGTVVPEPIRKGVSNVSDTLSLPSTILNDVLQADIAAAATNTLRLGFNLSFGFGGLIDVATAAGMPKKDNDFGKTLAVWGVGEGPYVELPFYGPSTGRDAVGRVVDIVSNPVGNVFHGKDRTGVLAAKGLEVLDDRYRYSNTVDSILYESEDSYAQARLLYLQNRRFELGRSGGADGQADDFIDPYEDGYGQ